MNKWFCFAGGVLIGGLLGYFGGKKLAEKQANERADEEIEEMRRYYERKSKYDGHCCNGDTCGKNVERSTDEDSETYETVQYESEERVGNQIDYSKCYKPGSAQTDLVSKEVNVPNEDEPKEDEESELERATQQVEEEAEERRMNQNRSPKIISAEAVNELPPYVTMQVLYYFPETDVLMDEDDHMVGEGGDYGHLVGNCLEKYGFGDDDNLEKIIFVRNYNLDACYEIQKMPGDDPITAAALEDSGEEY